MNAIFRSVLATDRSIISRTFYKHSSCLFNKPRRFEALNIKYASTAKFPGLTNDQTEINSHEDLYKFRTPPLYNVERSFPYSHSGSVYSLRKAVIYHFDPLRDFKSNDFSEIDRNEYYKKLAASGENIDSIPYLDSEEISSLVDFLKTLTFIKK